MADWNGRLSGALVVTLLGTTALHADVTAEEVWKNWSDSYTAMGYKIAVGAQDKSGDTLTLRDVVMTADLPEGKTTLTIPELDLEEQDGEVEVTLSEEITGEATVIEGETTTTFAYKLRQSDLAVTVSGVPENMAYAIAAPELVLELDAVEADGKALPLKLQATLSDTEGSYKVEIGAARTFLSDFTSAGLRGTVSGADPESGATFNMSGDVADLKLSGKMVLPEGVLNTDLGPALAGGMAMDVVASYGAGTYAVDGDSPDGPFKVTSAAESGEFSMAMSKDGISYRAGGKGTTVDMTAPDLPFPVSLSLDEALMDFAFPVTAQDKAVPFGAVVRLVGLSVSDEVWNMFDPGEQLPRDPATLIVDLSGALRPLADLFSTEATTAGAPPVEMEELNINEVKVSAVGAELTGTGKATFDNSQGIPMPLGSVDLKLAGFNGLMDKLVAMGLVPEDQMMFARMMLGLYAVPTGDDEMSSKIEFKAGGEIYANGQRVQ